MSRKLRSVLILITCLAGSGNGSAAPIFYIYTGIGSGMLGSNSFSDASFTITCTADTSQIIHDSTDPGLFFVVNTTATVLVDGIGSGTFAIPTANVDNQNLSKAGFSYWRVVGILFVADPAFADYDLNFPIGPVTGPAEVNRGNQYPTTAGLFQLSSVSSVSFQVIPEPSSLALGGLGGLALVAWPILRRTRSLSNAC